MPTICRWVAVKNGRFKDGLGSALLVNTVSVNNSIAPAVGRFRVQDVRSSSFGCVAMSHWIHSYMIVGIDENDLNCMNRSMAISDQQLVEILTQIPGDEADGDPDWLYRDIPLSPGTSQLRNF
jgi:hypothetical protein